MREIDRMAQNLGLDREIRESYTPYKPLLNFVIPMFEDSLFAKVEDGYYQIQYTSSEKFIVHAWLNGEDHKIEVGNIYEALEKANLHYEEYSR